MDLVVEVCNIGIAHAHAAMGGGSADEVFLICAVDVDVSFVGVCVVDFGSLQPEDATYHEIVGIGEVFVVGEFALGGGEFGSFGGEAADGFPSLENCIGGFIATDLVGDGELSGWCFEATYFGAEPELGGGDGVFGE